MKNYFYVRLEYSALCDMLCYERDLLERINYVCNNHLTEDWITTTEFKKNETNA